MRKTKPTHSARQSRRRIVFESLDPRLLLTATVFNDIQPAALDQPRINLLVRRPTGGPLSADFGTGPTINIEAFYDTGASGVLFSNETADALGIVRSTYNGATVVYQDVGVAGSDSFNVSEPLYFGLAPYEPSADLDNLATWQSVYNQTQGPIRAEIGAVPGTNDPQLQNLDVVGIAAMQNKVMVMDPTTANQFADTMRTYVYNPGTPFHSATSTTNPGIPAVNRHVRLSYGNFDRFTSTTPKGAAPPTLANNPFIGPNPVNQLLASPPADPTPATTITLGTKSAASSFLFDTGAGASMLSKAEAAKVGVTYVAGTFGTDNPQLAGVPLADQFTLTIGGIGGTTKVAGFFLDTLSIPTLEGEPLVFHNAPFLVSDVTVKDPVTNQTLTLDGIFGMNYLVASAFVTEGGVGGLPAISNLTANHFDWITFDQSAGLLGLQVPGASTVVVDTIKPTAAAAATNITAAGASAYNFTVTYTDNSAIKYSTIDGNDIKVTGPGGFSQLAQLVSVNVAANGTPRTATYKITPPGGTWNSADNGSYTINLQSGQVTDTTANAVDAAALKSFTVNITPTTPPPTTGTVTGLIFHDVNANGVKDFTEKTPLAATVFLDKNNNGIIDNGERSTVSSATSGNFTFTGVTPGTYQLRQIAPSGYRQTLPSKYYSITVTAGGTTGSWIFGDTALAYVQGRVWNDLNANKSIDTGEAGLAGWKVFIDANNDSVWQSSESFALTDASGYFVFNTLKPGTYIVRVQAVKNWTATSRTSQTVTLAAGQIWSKLGFGQKQ